MNGYDYDHDRGVRRRFSNLPAPIQAALFVALGILILNAITFLTAGTAAALSLPLLGLIYLGCGALAARLDHEADGESNPVLIGAASGLALWVVSFLVNAAFTLILGAPSLGLSILIGIPYLCLCGPMELLLGATISAFGGFLYGLFRGRLEDRGGY